MKAALTAAFVCTLLLVVELAPQAINPDCVFPFIYKGVTYQGCITKDHSTMWCATTSNYDSDRRWIECYGRAFNPDCVFPFIYKGETYQSCTTKDHSAMWCATTSNYDSDRRWITCNDRGENVAPRGQATQSTTVAGELSKDGYLAHAINAIDGNQDPNASHGSCSHTDYEYGPWWRVDLLKPQKIYAIYITNRDAFAERLNGADILVGNSLTNYGNNNERYSFPKTITEGVGSQGPATETEGHREGITPADGSGRGGGGGGGGSSCCLFQCPGSQPGPACRSTALRSGHHPPPPFVNICRPPHGCKCWCRAFRQRILHQMAQLEDQLEERVKILRDKHLKACQL